MLITDQAVFEFTASGVLLKEIAKGNTVEKIRALTDVNFLVSDNLGIMEDNYSQYIGGGYDDEDIFNDIVEGSDSQKNRE